MADIKIWLPWNIDDLVWGTTEYIWSEVYIVQHIADSFGGGGGGMLLPKKDTWNEVEKQLNKKNINDEQKKLFLQVVARVNGIVKSEVKTVDTELSKKITINHIRKTFQAFGHKVEVKVKKVKNQ